MVERARDASGPRPTRLSGVTIEQARAFCCCAQAGSYRGAADLLGFGRHVAVIRLVDRFTLAVGRGKLVAADHRGQVRLTPAGAGVLPAATRLVEAAEALTRDKQGIRFSSYPSIAGQVLAACPDLLTGERPLLLSDVSEQSRRGGGQGLLRELQDHANDLVIAPAGLARTGIVERAIYRWTLRVLLPVNCDPSVRRRETLRPRDLTSFSIAAAPDGHQSRRLFEGLCAREQVSLRVVLESASQEMLRELARSSPYHAAVIPDDAFGAPNKALGPALTSAVGDHWGGEYAIYRREPHDVSDVHERYVAEAADVIYEGMRARSPSD